ncbi:11753_t:CDS:2 [Ambispora gerdemannii]|uniref:11753_t:CDS:1 n=1 Tax=Ambispora gerdemannii TaxID=144530 RepID=A0A9N8V1N2_9GLOM|nr:11753_t:CDS:2 [Ambispora gerdemannii]
MAIDRNEALATLKAMFPDIDYLEEVLDAHDGALEPALNALLEISDPNYKSQDNIPVQAEGLLTSTSREQLLRDEELARNLAAEADRAAGYGPPSHVSANARNRPANTQQQQQQNSDFNFSDEIPVIKEKIVNVADTTKKKVREWYDRLKQQTRPETDENTNNPKYTNLPHNEVDNGRWEDDYRPVSNNSRQSGTRQIPRNSASKSFQTSNDSNDDNSSNIFPGHTGFASSSPTTTASDSSIKIIRQTNNSDMSTLNTQDKSSDISPYLISDTGNADPERITAPKLPSIPRRYEVTRASSADAEEISKD